MRFSPKEDLRLLRTCAESTSLILGTTFLLAGVTFAVMGPVALARAQTKIDVLNSFSAGYVPLPNGGGLGTIGLRF